MSCEDCENYKKKKETVKKDFHETGEKVNELLQNYCNSVSCSTCYMEAKSSVCMHEDLKEILRKSGWNN